MFSTRFYAEREIFIWSSQQVRIHEAERVHSSKNYEKKTNQKCFHSDGFFKAKVLTKVTEELKSVKLTDHVSTEGSLSAKIRYFIKNINQKISFQQ